MQFFISQNVINLFISIVSLKLFGNEIENHLLN